jgi:hypothetical protein
MMSDDQSRIYNSLRASTIALLGYDDVGQLSPAQEIRVSRAISLRLIVDAAQGKQLRGEPVDVKGFVEASESLERMCGGNPDQPAAAHDFSGAREELSRFLAGRADAIARRAAREAEPLESSKPIPDPGGGDAQSDGGVPQPPPSRAPAAGCVPAEPAPPQQTSPQPPLPSPDAPLPRQWVRDGQPRDNVYSIHDRWSPPRGW